MSPPTLYSPCANLRFSLPYFSINADTPNPLNHFKSLCILHLCITWHSNLYTTRKSFSQKPALDRAASAYHTLQEWYDPSSGLYNTTGWWNAANLVTTLSNLAFLDSSLSHDIEAVLGNTFRRAPAANPTLYHKTVDPLTFLISTTWSVSSHVFERETNGGRHVAGQAAGTRGWLNDYYDDEAWWALAWIRAFDLTSSTTYLQIAVEIFEDLEKAESTPCGGIWWDKQHTYVNAIANELYLAVAASLANRVPLAEHGRGPGWGYQKLLNRQGGEGKGRGRAEYLEIALRQWEWFEKSGLINEAGNINDGLSTTCQNNNGTVWSYNQGVILEALSELYLATSNSTFRVVGVRIAEAAIAKLTTSEGVLRDVCEEWGCGADGVQFKGVFMRGLMRLLGVLKEGEVRRNFEDFVRLNAESIWKDDRDEKGRIGVVWSGPLQEVNAGSQGSGLDALVGAAALGKSNKQRHKEVKVNSKISSSE